VELVESLPIQDGGRIKPLHTYASFTLLRMNGRRSVTTPAGERLSAVQWLLDVLFFPEAAGSYPIFLVQNPEVVQAIGLPHADKKRRDRYSLDELRPGVDRLFQLASEYHRIEEKERTSVQQQIFLLGANVQAYLELVGYLDFARQKIEVGSTGAVAEVFQGRAESTVSEVLEHQDVLLGLRGRMAAEHDEAGFQDISRVLMRASESVARSEALALIPAPVSAEENAAWMTPADVFFGMLQEGRVSSDAVGELAALEDLATLRNDPRAFEETLRDLHGSLTGRAAARGEYGKVGLELVYYKSKVLSYSHYGFVLSFLLAAFLWLRPRNRLMHGATSLAVLASTLLLIGAITMRCVIRGRPPVSTLYETVLFVTVVATLIAMFIEAVNRRTIAISAAALVGTVGLFIANGYEMLDKRDTMPSLVAVLDTNFWLSTHVTAITTGYSAGMLAALLASVYLVTKAAGWRRSDPTFHRSLGRMVYGVLCFALIFSTVGTILGGIWANDSWGRFWGWDPKENGALLIVLSQLAILHGRMGGYLREHTVCMATAFAGTVIAFSWWGVNLLGVGLHSYGFTSGINTAVWTYYGLQWSIVGVGGVTWLRDRLRSP
jgi:ABC-type transport system involved in cytochrome c biogenesis permease subunit